MFFIIFSLIYGGAHLYIWLRLVHPLEITGVSLRLLQGLFVLLFLSFPLIHIAFRQQNGFLITTANLLSSIWIGMVVYFVLVTVASDLLRLIIFRAVFDGRAVSAVITTIVVAITIYGLVEARSIGITRLQVRMPNLPGELEGLPTEELTGDYILIGATHFSAPRPGSLKNSGGDNIDWDNQVIVGSVLESLTTGNLQISAD